MVSDFANAVAAYTNAANANTDDNQCADADATTHAAGTAAGACTSRRQRSCREGPWQQGLRPGSG